MKKISLAVILLVVAFNIIGCGKPPRGPSQAEQVFNGDHKLRRIAERTDINSQISGAFFMFVGGVSGSTSTSVSVKFAWQMNDGVYAYSSLPLEKIRVNPDENATTPTIKFRWRGWNYNWAPQVQDLMDNYVTYAVITIREKDWPVQINMPLSK